MERNEALKRVLKVLTERNVPLALTEMQNFAATYQQPQILAELESLLLDYQVMKHYWQQGFKDPSLDENYQRLLQRTYQLYADTSRWRRIGSSPFLSHIYTNLSLLSREWSVASFRQEMETFVSNIALVELEPANKQQARRQELYSKHQANMDALFNYILTSRQWSVSTASGFEEILLLPTVNSSDQQLLVSAVTLSLMNTFDFEKFRVLVSVYRQSSDEAVRQRALVGWVLGRNYTISAIFPEERVLVKNLLAEEQVQHDLTELQIQLVYTVNAMNDHQKIQSEIMPDLMRGSSFRITRDGIEEVEDDTTEDILHPEAMEERMERMEKSMQKMVEMQKQGSDIYYGGFAHMKRFPFFQKTSNWFTPFFADHPDMTETFTAMKSRTFLDKMLATGPFCDSDKYSFSLAFSQVMERFPQNIRQMLEQGELSLADYAIEDKHSAQYIRRMYLQDLFRFFRLFPHSSQFEHPFQQQEQLSHLLFFKSPLFKGTALEPYFEQVASFLIRQRRYEDCYGLLDMHSQNFHSYNYFMMLGTCLQHLEHQKKDATFYLMLEKNYEQALELQPDSEKAMRELARICFKQKQYSKALALYDKLVAAKPSKMIYVLNRAVCQTNLQRYDDAQKDLFRLNYEQPDDLAVQRVLAWTLTCAGKYEQALHMYQQLTALAEAEADDFLNQGYCLWFSGGGMQETVDSFRRYLQETGETAYSVISSEQALLEAKGIRESEMFMMLDAIAS